LEEPGGASFVASEAPSVTASVRAFLRLSRPRFLAGGLAGGALGTAIAAFERGTVDWRAYALAQVTICAFQLMTHFANDYFDRFGDAGANRTAFSGGSGALVDGTVRPGVALRAALLCAALGIAGAAGLALLGLTLAAAIAIEIGLLAWCYSAPPLRLLGRGLGEATTALVVAVLVPLCAFSAQGTALDTRAIAGTLAGAAAMFAMMFGVEFPDLAVDAASGKRNLLVRLGARDGLRIAVAAVAAIYLAAAVAVACGAPALYAIALVLTLPPAAGFASELRRAETELVDAESLAGRGVALFFIVSVYGALAFAAGAGIRAAAGGG
jgi:1,4-dihydroxy-2-naphthoate octaprenyltransferase